MTPAYTHESHAMHRTLYTTLSLFALVFSGSATRITKVNSTDIRGRGEAACEGGFAPYREGNVTICVPCPKGHYSDTGLKCSPCEKGYYQSELGAKQCSQCPDGEISSDGEAQCVVCPSGKHAAEHQQSCTTCPSGTWSNAGDTFCSNCPAGTYNSRSGRPGCKDCGVGYFNPVEGASAFKECIACPQGFQCPLVATARPLACPRGYFSPGGQASACDKCPWMFMSNQHRTGCIPTLPFYIIALGCAGALGTVIMLLLLCPGYIWTKEKGFEDPMTSFWHGKLGGTTADAAAGAAYK